RHAFARLEVAVVDRHRVVVQVDERRLAARGAHGVGRHARELLVERLPPRAAGEHQDLRHPHCSPRVPMRPVRYATSAARTCSTLFITNGPWKTSGPSAGVPPMIMTCSGAS